MLKGFKEFQDLLDDKRIKMKYKNFERLLQKFTFLQILKNEI